MGILYMSKIVFIFDDGTEKEFGIGSCFKGLRHDGKRPVHANINIVGNIRFDILHRLSNEVYSTLRKRSMYEDITIHGKEKK